MAKCKYCGAEVTIGERCTYCGGKAESWYYPVAEKTQEPKKKKAPQDRVRALFNGKIYIVKKGDFDTLAVLSIQRSNGEKVEVNRYFKEGEKSFIEISPEEYEERKKMHEKRQEQEAKAQDEN